LPIFGLNKNHHDHPFATGNLLPSFKVDNITIILKGFNERITSLESETISTKLFFLLNENFREEAQIEFFEPGNYIVNISINN